MKPNQMKVLSALIKEDRNIMSLKEEFKISEEQILKLINREFAILDEGEGFCGGIRNLSLTSRGHKFIESYCVACECMPCDCGYGS